MNKEKFKKIKNMIDNNLGTIVILLVIVAVLLFLTPNQNLFSNSASKDPAKKNMQNVTDEDKNFKNWVYLSYRPIFDDLTCVSNAVNKKSFNETERCGRLLKDDTNRTLRQIETYNVSVYMQAAWSEYKKSLEYYNLGGLNLEMGARNRNINELDDANMYIHNGTDRIERVMQILKNASVS